MKTRGADVYAGFLLSVIRADMAVLDCGCGEGTITLGLAKAVPEGRVFGIDFEQCGLSAARRAAGVLGLDNLSCIPGMVGVCPFCDAEFDAVLCHSMLETVDDPMNLILELRRVTKHAGLVGAASVDYGGLILGGQKTAGPQRFMKSATTCGGQRVSPNRIWPADARPFWGGAIRSRRSVRRLHQLRDTSHDGEN